MQVIVKRNGYYEWAAQVLGVPHMISFGDSPKDAIGNLVVNFSKEFGVEINWQ
jgi:hypothetical protein